MIIIVVEIIGSWMIKNICNKKIKNNLKIIDVIYLICLLVYKVLKEGGMGYKYFIIFKLRILFLYYF